MQYSCICAGETRGFLEHSILFREQHHWSESMGKGGRWNRNYHVLKLHITLESNTGNLVAKEWHPSHEW